MSLLDRVRDLLRKPSEPPLTPDSPGLSVVAEAFEAAEADSAVLARSHRWEEEKPAVLRPPAPRPTTTPHGDAARRSAYRTLPADRVSEAAGILDQDGWELRTVSESDGVRTVHALRVQRLDALHCAQERSRMAGLAQRLGGDSLGWDALRPNSSR